MGISASVLIPKFVCALSVWLASRVRRQNRWMLARMSSAGLVQRNGFGSLFAVSMYPWMAVASSAVERWTPRRICFLVSSAKKRST